MVEHDPVLIVDDLGFVAELDWLAEPTFDDGTRVGIMQRHDACRTVRRDTGDPLASLSRDSFDACRDALEVRDQRGGLGGGRFATASQRPPRVAQHRPGPGHPPRRDDRHLGSDGPDLVLGLAGAVP
jgi:hypothetical protein